jgi:hypothetical protein
VRWAGLAVAASLALAATAAEAQDVPAPPARAPDERPSKGAADDADARTLARERYADGVRLYRTGAFSAALTEFRAAYAASPSFRVLYNVAQVEAQLHDYAEAIDTFERYLTDGGTAVDPARVSEVNAEIARMAPFVARIEVTSTTPGAHVFLDDIDLGEAPRTKRVNVGPRTVRVSAPGYRSATERLMLSSGESRPVGVDLELLPVAPDKPPVTTTRIVVRETSRPVPRSWVTARWAFGLGTVVVGGAAAALGTVSVVRNGELEEALAAQPGDADRITEARRSLRATSLAADVFFVLGGISLAGFVVSLMGPFGGPKPSATVARARPSEGPRLLAAPGGARVELRF